VRSSWSIAKDSTPLQEKLTKTCGHDQPRRVRRGGADLSRPTRPRHLEGTSLLATSGPETVAVVGELLDYFVTMVIVSSLRFRKVCR